MLTGRKIRNLYIVVTLDVPIERYNDVKMGSIASQITSLTIVYSTVYSDADQRKHQSSTSLAFVRAIHGDRWPVTRKMFLFDDVIMERNIFCDVLEWT